MAENKQRPALPIEQLNDVAVFDEAADAETMRQQNEQLAALIHEQNNGLAIVFFDATPSHPNHLQSY